MKRKDQNFILFKLMITPIRTRSRFKKSVSKNLKRKYFQKNKVMDPLEFGAEEVQKKGSPMIVATHVGFRGLALFIYWFGSVSETYTFTIVSKGRENHFLNSK